MVNLKRNLTIASVAFLVLSLVIYALSIYTDGIHREYEAKLRAERAETQLKALKADPKPAPVETVQTATFTPPPMEETVFDLTEARRYLKAAQVFLGNGDLDNTLLKLELLNAMLVLDEADSPRRIVGQALIKKITSWCRSDRDTAQHALNVLVALLGDNPLEDATKALDKMPHLLKLKLLPILTDLAQ
jgi:hypothetical protein